jgi:hypothetical protein
MIARAQVFYLENDSNGIIFISKIYTNYDDKDRIYNIFRDNLQQHTVLKVTNDHSNYFFPDINKLPYFDDKIEVRYTEDKIRKVQDQLSKDDWGNISKNQKLSEDFIREFQDKVNWSNISEFQTLSEDFIREFQNKVNWIFISRKQTLSEDFIREFQDKVHWINISEYQTLSEDFIREFQNKINWNFIFYYQKLSKEFIREFQNKANFDI